MTHRADLEPAAQLFKVLSSASRLRLLCILKERPVSVGALAAAAELSQPLVSQHLRTLRAAGLVTVVRHGREAEYSLADAHVAHIVADAVSHTLEEHTPRI